MRSRSVVWRMLVALVTVFALGFCSLAAYLYDSRDELRRTVMFIQAREITAVFAQSHRPEDLPRHFAGGEMSYTWYAADGSIRWKSANLERPRRLRPSSLAAEHAVFRVPVRSGRVVSVPVSLADGSTLMVAKRDDFERETIGALLETRMIRGLLLQLIYCALAAGVILLVLRWILRPIREAARRTATLGPDNPSSRIPLDNLPREILPLVHAANSGFDRVARAHAREKRFFEDAAHELRTPFAVLDLRLQQTAFVDDADRRAIAQDMQHVRRLLGQLLTLSRSAGASSGDEAVAASIDVSGVAREAAASLIPLFEDQSRTLEVAIIDGVRAKADAHALREALVNLVENALLHGKGMVQLRVSRVEDTCIVEVEDQGDGVPLSTQDDVFERFRKGRHSRAGSGLGLAIAHRTAQVSGGSLRFVACAPCVLRLSLPASDFHQPRSA